MQEINYILDLRSFVWPVRKIVNVMQDHGFCRGFCRCESEWKKTFEKELTEFSLCVSASEVLNRSLKQRSRSLTLPK